MNSVIKTCYHVTEYFDDEAPEEFGDYIGNEVKKGDIIQLMWLSGKPAYKVEVFNVNGFDIKVKKVN